MRDASARDSTEGVVQIARAVPAPDLFPRAEPGRFRAVALVQSFDARRTLGACLSNLAAQGLEVYLLDNESTDGSREIAESFLGRGVLAVEVVPRERVFDHARLLRRKEAVARRIDADWFLSVDSDEIVGPPAAFATVLDALRAADEAGCDAANLFEYAFVPTAEEPDHDHPRFVETMRWYYPFGTRRHHRLAVWKRRTGEIGLAASGGHDVRLPGTKLFDEDLVLRHYLFLSRPHALEKYEDRRHAIEQVSRGWHGWRERLDPGRLVLPSRSRLRPLAESGVLDPSDPEPRHLFVLERSRLSAPATRTAVLVLGMHRSGTSALTGCLLGLGARLGGPLLPPKAGDNDKGYFELERVMQLHDRLLASFGATPLDVSSLPAGWERDPLARAARVEVGRVVDELFTGEPLWALKDPRLCPLLPLWLPVLSERGIEPRFVLVARNPWEVVRSLGRRGVPVRAAAAAWLAHVVTAERYTRGRRRSLVRFPDLLAHPVEVLERLGAALGIEWPCPPGAERGRIEAFLDADLKRQSETPVPLEIGPGVARAFERLHGLLAELASPALVDGAAARCWRLLAEQGWPQAWTAPEEEAHRIEWLAPDLPERMTCGNVYEVVGSWKNVSDHALAAHRLSASYHWFDELGRDQADLFEGLRTPVGRALPPMAREEMRLRVQAPATPGRYRLELDLVREDICWFSDAGARGPSGIVTVVADA